MNYLIHNTGRNQVLRKPIPRLFPKVGEWRGEPETHVLVENEVVQMTFMPDSPHVFSVGDEVECLPFGDQHDERAADCEGKIKTIARVHENYRFIFLDDIGAEKIVEVNGVAKGESNWYWPIRALRLIRAASAPVTVEETEPQEKDGWIYQGACLGSVWWKCNGVGVWRYPDGHWESEFNERFSDWPSLKRAIKEKTKCK